MIIREIKGYEHIVQIGENKIREVLNEELSDEAMDFISRIELSANDLLENAKNTSDNGNECINFAQDLLIEMYNYIRDNLKDKDYILKYINSKFTQLEEWKNG